MHEEKKMMNRRKYAIIIDQKLWLSKTYPRRKVGEWEEERNNTTHIAKKYIYAVQRCIEIKEKYLPNLTGNFNVDHH